MAARMHDYTAELGEFAPDGQRGRGIYWSPNGSQRWLQFPNRREARRFLEQWLREHYLDVHVREGSEDFCGKEPHRMLAFRLRRGYKGRKRFEIMSRWLIRPPKDIRNWLRRQNVAVHSGRIAR